MTTYLIATLLLIGMSIFYLKLAKRYNITDKPNARSSHDTPTIRGGGILFLMALVFFFLQNDFQYPYLLAGTLLVGGVSFVDDLKPLSPLLRLPFQLIAIFFVLIQLDLWGCPLVVLCDFVGSWSGLCQCLQFYGRDQWNHRLVQFVDFDRFLFFK